MVAIENAPGCVLLDLLWGLGVTVAANAKPLDDVLVDPRRGGEGHPEAQRDSQPRDVRAQEDGPDDRRAVTAVAKVGPVARRVVEGR
eukprot:scaffold11019_cov75-Phaeocystis_antarctica.AAC.1